MSIRRRVATVVAGLAIAVGGAAATATPAAAVGGCPSDKLCLYSGANFTSLKFTAASTQACFDLDDYGLANNVRSYVNNLPVNAVMYEMYPAGTYTAIGTIRPGGFSSDTANTEIYSWAIAVCMGGVNPNSVLG
ncbi:peptidase inhibitor family I36 protein [Streptomyces sp. NPDC003857]